METAGGGAGSEPGGLEAAMRTPASGAQHDRAAARGETNGSCFFVRKSRSKKGSETRLAHHLRRAARSGRWLDVFPVRRIPIQIRWTKWVPTCVDSIHAILSFQAGQKYSASCSTDPRIAHATLLRDGRWTEVGRQ